MLLKQALAIIVPALASFAVAAVIGVTAFGDPVINSYTIASFCAGGVAGAGGVLATIRSRTETKKSQ
jgi:hypothetical protein